MKSIELKSKNIYIFSSILCKNIKTFSNFVQTMSQECIFPEVSRLNTPLTGMLTDRYVCAPVPILQK